MARQVRGIDERGDDASRTVVRVERVNRREWSYASYEEKAT